MYLVDEEAETAWSATEQGLIIQLVLAILKVGAIRMIKRFENPWVPVGIAGLIGAQLWKQFIGATGPAIIILSCSCCCLLLGVLQNRPGRGRYRAANKRLILGGLDESNRKRSN